jgi:hypothetical protein
MDTRCSLYVLTSCCCVATQSHWVLPAGILYAKYKTEKLMEHLKLFSARINIPRLIRVCEEYHHWKELVFLYIQYDEYDNAALVMMSHSPVAWEHVQFKDVAVKVSNVEVYYKAITFYLEEHPELLTDLLKVRYDALSPVMQALPCFARRFSQAPGVSVGSKTCGVYVYCGREACSEKATPSFFFIEPPCY